MEKQYSSTDRSAVFDRDLSLPHFDEEATLLSARPVVPLDEVKSKTQTKRRLMFGLTILTAILVGAAGATLLMKSEQNSQKAVRADQDHGALSFTGAAGGSTPNPIEASVPPVHESVEVPQMVEAPKVRDSSIRKREPAAMSHSSAKPIVSRNSVKPVRNDDADYESTESFENDEREVRRAERRDARRDAKRQNRNRHERLNDDVLRIREIFEGSPRP
jgi:hypothetical protein